MATQVVMEEQVSPRTEVQFSPAPSADLISVIIPAYNEAGAIGDVVRRVRAVAGNSEILVIDDGSNDGTGEMARAAGARVLRHPSNRGPGASIRTGIRAAQGSVVVMLDGDGQHDPEDIPRLLAGIDSYDMVVGARNWNSGVWYRNVANWIYNRFATYMAGFRVYDLTSGFRAIRAPVAHSVCYLLPNSFSCMTTITLALARAGFGVTYIPIEVHKRIGQSKISPLKDGLRFFTIMAKVTMLFSPLKVFGPLGLLVALPGFIYAIYRLIVHAHWTIPITISLTVGTLIICLGLISEQIATLRLQHMD